MAALYPRRAPETSQWYFHIPKCIGTKKQVALGADMATAPQHPLIYLISPPVLHDGFDQTLTSVLDAHEISCFRLALASMDELDITHAGDLCRDICHAHDVPIVIDSHVQMVERLGLDGVHLTGHKPIRDARKTLGADAIIGSHCFASKHDGMNAGEIGADYVSFGPTTPSALGDGTLADAELFQWWSDFIEVPVVAQGGLDDTTISALKDCVDFFALGAEVWDNDNPNARLKAIRTLISG